MGNRDRKVIEGRDERDCPRMARRRMSLQVIGRNFIERLGVRLQETAIISLEWERAGAGASRKVVG